MSIGPNQNSRMITMHFKVYLFCDLNNFVWLLVAAPLHHCACFLVACELLCLIFY